MVTSSGGIVVGVDGSADSLVAVDWAAAEAAASGAALTICHATPYGPPFDLPVEFSHDEMLARGQEVVQEAAGRARAVAADLVISEVVSPGSVTPLLLERSATARLVVVGCRGVGAFRGLLLGSVSLQVAAHASCPAVVVRGGAERAAALAPDAPVTVGIDWSSHEAALAFAVDYAARHHRPLVAVHAYRLPPPDPQAESVGGRRTAVLPRAATDLLDDALAQWRTKYPEVAIRSVALDAEPAAGLIGQSAGSALVVVGSRGHGGFAGLLLGSVSQHVLRHAECPVAIIRR